MDSFDRETGEVMEPSRLPSLPEPQPSRNLIFASPECGQVFGALCEMQGSMDSPKRTKKAKVKGQTKRGTPYEYEYSYAPLDEIINTVKKPMSQSGLAYRQFLASRDGQWVMRTVIGHKSGEWMAADYPIFWEQERGMQGFASGVTYARRYGLMLALGIAAEDDDDANVADGNPATINQRPARSVPRPAPEAQNRTQGNLHPASPAAASLNEAPFDPVAAQFEAKARRLYREMIDELNAATDEAGLDAIATTGRFHEIAVAVNAFAGPEKKKEYMDQLDRHLAARRAAVRRLPGEMA